MANYGYQITLAFYTKGKALIEKKDGADVAFVRTFNKVTNTNMKFNLKVSESEISSYDYGSLSLSSMNYHKQLYKPNCINATLEFSTDEGLKSMMVDIAELFCEARVKMEVISIEETKGPRGSVYSITPTGNVVAENYVIYEAHPHFDSARGKKLYLELVIYSPDKALDTIAYSKAYRGKRLGNDILASELKDLLPKKDGAGNDEKPFQKVSMTFLESTYKELVQPYLVQYNETFYSFLARVANRCGEFLYYENSNLHLGRMLPNSERLPYTEDIFDKITVSKQKENDESLTSQKFCYNYNNSATQEPTGMFVSNSEMTGEEYMESVTKNKFADVADERDFIGHAWPLALGTLFTNMIGAGIITNIFTVPLELCSTAGGNAKAINEKFNKKYFDGSKDTTKRLYSSGDVTISGTSAVNLNSLFYENIEKLEATVDRNLVSLQITSGLDRKIKLGDSLKLFEKEYVIVDIQAKYEFFEDKQTGSTGVNQPICILAAPTIKSTEKGDTVIPVPFSLKERVRKSDPQLAKVVDVDDPAGLGRVQVRFCWQKKTGDESPWIRVATQMANSSGGAAYFKASKDDNVLIDFDNGNVDLPYVSGFLPNINQQKNKGQYLSRRNSVVISSENGQMMIMNDPPKTTGLLGDYVGRDHLAMGFGKLTQGLSKIPGLHIPSAWDKDEKRWLGSTEFTDYYGLYSLKMSSTDKAITINSPFGKVEMNAFTGITLNSPNGDIKISGKNVTIESQNNLTIESGLGIYDLWGRTWQINTAVSALANVAVTKGLNKYVADMEYIRDIAEMIIGPVEGTLSIKSGRYLLLQAGGATPGVPKTGFVVPKPNDALKEDEKKQLISNLLKIMSVIDGFVNGVVYDVEKAQEMVKECNNTFKYGLHTPTGRCLVKVGGEVVTREKVLTKANDVGEFTAEDLTLNDECFTNGFNEKVGDSIGFFGTDAKKTSLSSTLNKLVQQIRDVKASTCYKVVDQGGLFKLDYKEGGAKLEKYKKILDRLCCEAGADAKYTFLRDALIAKFNEKMGTGIFSVNSICESDNRQLLKKYLAAKVLYAAANDNTHHYNTLDLTSVNEPDLSHQQGKWNKFIYTMGFVDPWKTYTDRVFARQVKGIGGNLKEALINVGKETFDRLNPVRGLTGSWRQGWRKWDKESRGQILMSDVEGQTMYFNNGQLATFNNSDIYALRFFCRRRFQ